MPEKHSDDIMQELRSLTRENHESTERAVDIPEQLKDKKAYTKMLERFFGFYAALNKKVDSNQFASELHLQDAVADRLNWLESDLTALGGMPGIQIQACDCLPSLQENGAILGCFYVIQGSMLGGQFITKQINRLHGITPDTGGRFFYGYGEETGKRWRMFGDIVRQYMTPENRTDIITAAKATFVCIENWMAGQSAA